ncbi:MAG: LacI family DNA-binding transcriptional regulator [Paracoccaceae bacterium]
MAPRTTQAKRTTIYDLAELAGTSPSAVSAVLNGNWKKRRISVALAERITRIADEQGYAVNMQASALRRQTSHLIGMIVPKYDNRYFGSIVERFESMARDRGLFPIITCTQRDPELEMQAARAMISHQVECLVATGATDPDRIADLCAAAGVRTVNLDLPGSQAPSVISDNFAGARDLTRRLIAGLTRPEPLLFIGGRAHDHNTAERIRGFRAAHEEAGLPVHQDLILPCGYAPEKAEQALARLAAEGRALPAAMFVNSTISLEGVMRWIKSHHIDGRPDPRIGCFDWDPLAEVLADGIAMVRQDVPGMLEALFGVIDAGETGARLIQIPTIAEPRQPASAPVSGAHG